MAIKTIMQAIRETMQEQMRIHPDMFLIGEDVGPYGGEMGVSKGLWDEFGDLRVQDFPISESGIIGCGLGAALTGCKAIAEIPFSDFLGVCMDQVYNQAAKMHYMFGGKAEIPLVIRTPYGGYQRGAAQHSQSLEAWFMHIPGLKVVMPSTPYDAKGLLVQAIEDNNPVLFLEHKAMYQVKGEVPEEPYSIEFGKGRIRREGTDLTVVATGLMISKVLEVADSFAKQGVSIEVIDPRTLVPFDEELVFDSVRKTRRALVVHEAWRRGGVGAEISSMIHENCFSDLERPVSRIGAEHVPIPFSPILEDHVLPGTEKIRTAIEQLLA